LQSTIDIFSLGHQCRKTLADSQIHPKYKGLRFIVFDAVGTQKHGGSSSIGAIVVVGTQCGISVVSLVSVAYTRDVRAGLW
jgi:hypothetical protein